MATATNEEIKKLLEALDTIKEYPRKRDEESDLVVEGLTALFENFNKDPKGTPDILRKTVNLTGVFSFPKISAKIARPPLVVFRHVWKTYSEFYRAPEHPSVSSNIKGKAFGFISKLKDALRCLTSLTGNHSDSKQISTACSEIPLSGSGNEFFGDVQFEILQLQRQKNGEKCEETEARYGTIVDYLDLYCSLATLWEFVFLYVVILCIANGNSQNLAEGYFGVIEGQRKDKESTLKILSEPEAEFAGVSAVFMNGDWPMLKIYMERVISSRFNYLNSLDRKKVKILCAEDDTFAMFRHPSEEVALFTQTKYIRVFRNKYTTFVLEKEFALNTYFEIRLDAERDLTLRVDGSARGELVTKRGLPTARDRFNIIPTANGNFMLSSTKYPTCFVTMTSSRNDACLETKNLGAGLNSQWKIVPL